MTDCYQKGGTTCSVSKHLSELLIQTYMLINLCCSLSLIRLNKLSKYHMPKSLNWNFFSSLVIDFNLKICLDNVDVTGFQVQ